MRLSSKSFINLLFFGALLFFNQSRALTPEDINIKSRDLFLKGKFYCAEGDGIFPTVILLHGFPGNEMDVLGICEKLSQSGINAFTFNYSGTFQSQGLASAENDLKDIHSAFKFIFQPEHIIRYKIDTSLVYLGGWSHGGGMALAYATTTPELNAVFSIAGNDFGEFMREYARNPEMKKIIDDNFEKMTGPTGSARFEKGATPKEIAEIGIDKMSPIFDLKQNVSVLAKKDILLIGGWNDSQAKMEQFLLPLYRLLQNEKAKNVKIMAIQDGHNFKNTREELARVVIEWIKSSPNRK
jgi:dipeptidyl aminopeptidase/acylaminoacyl peptidase